MTTGSELEQLAHSVPEQLDGSDKSSEAIARLSAKLEAARDAHKEERFIWVMVIVIIVDAFLFMHMDSWAGPVCISILELLFLIHFGRKHGVEDISVIIDKILKSDVVKSHRGG